MDYDKDIKEDAYTEDQEMEESSGWNSVDPNVKPEVVHIDPEVPILDEEPDVSAGVGAALKLAMSKGYLEKEDNNRPSNSRLAHLQAKHYSIEDKSYGEEGDRVNNRRERYSGPIQDFREKDGFKPNVKLEYIDDEGHILNSKEAFRYLSHKFHGKGPGKNKIEKRIKKNVQEGVRNVSCVTRICFERNFFVAVDEEDEFNGYAAGDVEYAAGQAEGAAVAVYCAFWQ